MYETIRYVIAPASMLCEHMENCKKYLYEKSIDAVRFSLDKAQVVVKYSNGNIPPLLKNSGLTTYTHAQIKDILAGADWNAPEPE